MKKIEKILKDLYNGDINPNENIPTSDEYKELVKEANKIVENVKTNMTEKEKELIDLYIEKRAQITSIECENKFIEGYKLACKLLISGILK